MDVRFVICIDSFKYDWVDLLFASFVVFHLSY